MSSSSVDSHTRPGPGSSDGRAEVRRLVVLSLVPSVLVTAVALAVQIPALSEVPDPAAVHWSGGGPDGRGLAAAPGVLVPRSRRAGRARETIDPRAPQEKSLP